MSSHNLPGGWLQPRTLLSRPQTLPEELYARPEWAVFQRVLVVVAAAAAAEPAWQLLEQLAPSWQLGASGGRLGVSLCSAVVADDTGGPCHMVCNRKCNCV